MAITLAVLAASLVAMPAWGQQYTAQPSIDRTCGTHEVRVVIPTGQIARDFTFDSLKAGVSCTTRAIIYDKAWGISTDTSRSGNVYYYNHNGNGSVYSLVNNQRIPLPLDKLTLSPGVYFFHVDGGIDATVKVFFRLAPVAGVVPTATMTGSWEYVGIGDCPGNDIAGGAQGTEPDPRVCDRQHAGLAAVCWDSHTPRVMSPPGCTVKSVRAENCKGGVNPGRMYRCNVQGTSTNPPAGTTSASERVFVDPKMNGYHIDNCLTWGAKCQKPAADYFCRQNGYNEASSFNLVGRHPTLVMGDGKICNEDFCVGFSRIVCGGGTASNTTNRNGQDDSRTKTSQSGKESVIFYNGNDAGVSPGGRNPRFSIDRPVRITYIFTYHYGYAGATGNIRIMNANGAEIGIWQAQGRSGSPKPSWYWEITPNVDLQPGTYLIETSSPGSWSQNPGSGGNGMVQIKGVYLNP